MRAYAYVCVPPTFGLRGGTLELWLVCVARTLLSAAQAAFNAAQARRSVGEQKQKYERASRSFAKTGFFRVFFSSFFVCAFWEGSGIHFGGILEVFWSHFGAQNPLKMH